jgi:hypothetical protein
MKLARGIPNIRHIHLQKKNDTEVIGYLSDYETSATYQHFGVDLSAYIGQSIYIALVRHGHGLNGFCMDNLKISMDAMMPQMLSLERTTEPEVYIKIIFSRSDY